MEKVVSTVTIERSEYDALHTKLTELEMLVKYYEQQLLSAKRRQFGASSEKTDINPHQLNLFGNEEAVPPPETEEIHYTRKKRKGKRGDDFQHHRNCQEEPT